MNFEINIKQAKAALNIRNSQLVAMLGIFGFIFFPNEITKNLGMTGLLGLMLASSLTSVLIYMVVVSPWLTKMQVSSLEYFLDESVLYVKEGAVFRKNSAIPVEKITDIILAQGPIQRIFNIWSVKIQTAGMGHKAPEVILLGLPQPEKIRADLLAAARNCSS